MRTSFINQLIEEARHNDKIFLLVGDLGYHVVEPFAQEFPNRFVNVGLAEYGRCRCRFSHVWL